MASIAKITIVGNLGRDPEMRYTPNGKPVTEFSVAVSLPSKNQQTGEWIDFTDWYRVTVWGDRAERAAEVLHKGSRVFVEGRFKTRTYTTKDGRNGMSLEVTADNWLTLDPRQQDDGGPAPSTSHATAPADDDLDDLPF